MTRAAKFNIINNNYCILPLQLQPLLLQLQLQLQLLLLPLLLPPLLLLVLLLRFYVSFSNHCFNFQFSSPFPPHTWLNQNLGFPRLSNQVIHCRLASSNNPRTPRDPRGVMDDISVASKSLLGRNKLIPMVNTRIFPQHWYEAHISTWSTQ